MGTHGGGFHCDEVVATMMLLYTEQYKNSLIVRTRKEEVFPMLDIVCDVGGVYSHEQRRYDHHMATFTETWNNDETKDITKLSSAGLIFKHYGREVITNACKQWNQTFDEKTLENVFQRVYNKLILEVDCMDNGVNVAPQEHTVYSIRTHLGARVGRFNSSWNSMKSVNQHEQFKKAMKVAEEDFLWTLRGIVLCHLPAYQIVKEAWDKRFEFHPSGNILYMSRFAPWKEFIFEIEEEEGKEGEILFQIQQDGRGCWRITTMSAKRGSFDNRVSIFKDWSGLRAKELQDKSGIHDAEFVHRALFTGAA